MRRASLDEVTLLANISLSKRTFATMLIGRSASRSRRPKCNGKFRIFRRALNGDVLAQLPGQIL